MKLINTEGQGYKPSSYAFCTIAIGEEYLQSAINFANKLNEFSDEHHYVIITKGDTPAIQNTTFVQIPVNQPLFIQNIFNYNLKYLPIKISSELGFEYIFFVDSDWKLENEFSTKKINTVISFMETNNYDMLFERPHSIGEGKHDKDNCFLEIYEKTPETKLLTFNSVSNFPLTYLDPTTAKLVEYWNMKDGACTFDAASYWHTVRNPTDNYIHVLSFRSKEIK